MTPFDQSHFSARCEWGLWGVDALGEADVTIVVDVLSFTTCVDIALSNGITILPYRWKDNSAKTFAEEQQAVLAGSRGESGFSLSPASFLTSQPDSRCVLPSPNGATICLRAAERSGIVLAGCLRNALAVADAAMRIGKVIHVIPAGERWPDGSLRPCLEDWIGAGAILSALLANQSPEAMCAVSAYSDAGRRGVPSVLAECSSGREPIERGFRQDVSLATQLNVSTTVPRFDGIAFLL